MRYCGNCGASLSPENMSHAGGYGGVCPLCGTPISPMDDLEAAHTIDISQEPTHQPFAVLDAEDLPAFPSLSAGGDTDPPTVRRTPWRFPIRPVTLLALVVLALLLALGSVLLLTNAPGPLHLAANGLADKFSPDAHATATALASPSAVQPSPTNSGFSGPLASPVASPASGTPGAGTPTPEASTTPTATAAPGQPSLAVAPLKITFSACLAAKTQFTVTNLGDGTMEWSASASSTLYNVSPQGGFLSHGQQQTVTVSNITLSGSITVSAPGAANTPETVTITCGL